MISGSAERTGRQPRSPRIAAASHSSTGASGRASPGVEPDGLLGGELRRPVRAGGRRALALGDRLPLRGPVHGGRGREHHPVGGHGLQQAHRALDVGGEVPQRLLERFAHAGERREMATPSYGPRGRPSGTSRSPRTGRTPSGRSRFRRTSPSTSCPAATSRRPTACPMYPAAPVTSTRMRQASRPADARSTGASSEESRSFRAGRNRFWCAAARRRRLAGRVLVGAFLLVDVFGDDRQWGAAAGGGEVGR